MMRFNPIRTIHRKGETAHGFRAVPAVAGGVALIVSTLVPASAIAQSDPYGRPQRPPEAQILQNQQAAYGAQQQPAPRPRPSNPIMSRYGDALEQRMEQQMMQQAQPQPVMQPAQQQMPQPAPQPVYQQPVMAQPPMAQPVMQQPAPPPVPMTPEQQMRAQQAALNKALGIEQSNVRFGVALFPSAPPPADSCIAKVGPVGDTTGFDQAVDGSKLKDIGKLESFRKKQKTGTLYVRGGNFEGQKIKKRKLSNMCFIDANFRYTNWEEFKGEGVGFINSDLTGAKIDGAQMPYSLFRDVILADVNATGADLSYSRLDGGWKGSMRDLVLTQANLTGFRVECGYTAENGCPFDRQGLKLQGANMTKASFYAFDFPDVDITDAIMDQTEIGLQHVARLSGAKLVGPMVVRSHNNAAIYLPTEYARLRRALLTGIQGMASFDCAGIQSTVKKAICASSGSELRRLDREVARLNQDIERRNRRGLADKTRWEEAVASKCGALQPDDMPECLKVEYRQRRDELLGRAGAPDWMKPNSYALFIASEAPISKEFLESELFLRVRPVVFDSAPAKVMVEIDRKGRMTAKGSAMGSCRLFATDLTFDRNSGWVTAGGTPKTRRRAAVPGTPVLRAIGDELSVYRDGTLAGGENANPSPYAQCGPNGSFTLMQIVPLPQEELAQIWNIFR